MSNYFTFNGKQCPDFLKVQTVGISALPSLEVELTTLPNRFGVLETGTRFGERVISFEVMLVDKTKTIFQMASELAVFLKGDNWKLSKLALAEVAGKHMMAKVRNNVDISDLLVAGSGTIEFVVPNPVYVSDIETTLNQTAKTYTITNTGTQTVFPKFTLTLTQAVTFISINNSAIGKTFRVDSAFKIGDVVEFDFNKKTIKVNGVLNLGIFNIESDWLELASGSNPISVNASATTVIKFTEMHL